MAWDFAPITILIALSAAFPSNLTERGDDECSAQKSQIEGRGSQASRNWSPPFLSVELLRGGLWERTPENKGWCTQEGAEIAAA